MRRRATTRPTRTGCSSSIDWPTDGYRLFEIGHFIGDRDWFDGVGRATACSCPARCSSRSAASTRASRCPAAATPTSSSTSGSARRPTSRVVTHPRRGLVPPGPRRHHHQPGRPDGAPRAGVRLQPALRRAPRPAASRVRASRSTTSAGLPTIGRPAHQAAPHDRRRRSPTPRAAGGRRPAPSADAGARRARARRSSRPCWRSLPWTTHDLARPARSRTAPTDLLAYQELIATVRPDWIDRDRHRRRRARPVPGVDLRARSATARSSRVGAKPGDDRPQHPRITYVEGQAHNEADRRRGRARLVGDAVDGLVVLGSRGSAQRHAPRVRGLLRRSCRSAPTWSSPTRSSTATRCGPASAPGRPRRERRSSPTTASSWPTRAGEAWLTFNPGGFLRRVR